MRAADTDAIKDEDDGKSDTNITWIWILISAIVAGVLVCGCII